ncbi:MAG: low specificity L-threonine aldolase [Parvularculaceae bacterium]|jgi:threonine aldolase|nr:low specificity L-threonine aldolase [Parvularculaceae bacterium]
MRFGSDNMAPAHPRIMDALARANEGYARAYGGDEITARVEELFGRIFERDVAVFLVGTGGAANALALSALTPPWGMILAHEASHVQMDECGGVELATGGAKILPVAGGDGKLTPAAVLAALSGFPERPPHGTPATALSLTQASELGTVYAPAELHALSELAHARGLAVHLDGARFANAVAALGVSPADLSWRAGVDAMSFGGTKNGCIMAEAVVFFDQSKAEHFAFRRKRAGHLFSKSRYLAAQFEAYFDGGLWLDLAGRANGMAKRLADGITALDGARLWHPQQANEVFASLPPGAEERLRAAGAEFYPWITPGDPAGGRMIRLVCSWATTTEDVDAFLAIAGRR